MARYPLEPNFENCALEALDVARRAAPTMRSHTRILAIRMLFYGQSHETVAAVLSVTRRTLYGWIRRFNERGVDGLIERSRSGRPRKISEKQTGQYRQLIEHPEEAGEMHWTAKKFHGYLREQLQHEVGYTTILRWLKDNDYRLKVPQPWPDRQDEELRKAFVEKLREYLTDNGVDIWYGDEMGVEGDPRPRRRWAKKGEKTRVTHNGEHIRMNVTGMVCPRRGEFYALEFSHSDSVTFQVFLDNANADIELERPRNLLIVDNASWHKNKSIDWGRFEPLFLPPYSPDLNPIERLWLLIKAEWFTDFIAKNLDSLMERLDQALLWAMKRNTHNQKTCSIKKKI